MFHQKNVEGGKCQRSTLENVYDFLMNTNSLNV